MSEPHRAQHRQSEGDYYAETQRKLQQSTQHLGAEDRGEAQQGVQDRTQRAAADYSVAQGQLLQQGQTSRGDSPTPGQNYASSTHEQLHSMVHEGLDLDSMNERSQVTNDFGNWLADASNAFADAATTAGASWQGTGASQASTFFQDTASHAEHTSNAVQLVSNHYSQQSAAAHYAKTNMPEPTGFDQQAEMDKAKQQYNSGDLVGMNTTMNGIQAKQQQADAAHQQAVQVLQGLDSTYHETASTQPTYAPPPQLGSGDSTSVSGFHGTSSSGFSGTPGVGVGTSTGGTGVGGTSGAFLPPGGVPGTGATPPPGNSYVPPGAVSGTGGTGGNFAGNAGFRGAPAAGGFGRMTPDGLAMPGATGVGGGGGAGGDITRGKSGPGRAGSGFAGSRVSGGGATGSPKETAGEGAKSGGKSGERLERGATAAAAAKGKGGASGAAAGGAGGKKKKDDKEHKNKFAVDEDVFDLKPERGPDGEKIVRPTIGEA